jgi:hypothetical protein
LARHGCPAAAHRRFLGDRDRHRREWLRNDREVRPGRRRAQRHGGAVGPCDFGLDTSSGDDAKLKYPEQNYDDSFETVRDGCGDGWVVFEIPQSSQAEKVTFGFEDTGTSQHPETQVDAKFSWTVSD